MSVTDEANFTIAMRRQGGEWRWIVTCDRCGVDLSSADFSDAAITVIKLDGLATVLAEDPALADEIRARLDEGWRRARATRTPMIIDAKDDVVEVGKGLVLQEVITTHADSCGKVSA